MLLAADLGGTKTNLALIDPAAGPRAPLAEASLASAEHASLTSLVEAFLAQCGQRPGCACFGVAGPVVAGRARITNLGWELSERELAAGLGLARVWLLNDMAATATAVWHLEPGDRKVLQAGEPVAGGNLAVVAPGTGLGEGYATWDGRRYLAFGSEGGHADFAPLDEEGRALLAHLAGLFEHVSYERICSGIGLPNVYAFLRDTGRAPEPAWLAERLRAQVDPNPVIVAAAQDPGRPCEIARRSLEIFCRALGAESGNLALKIMATGGVSLAGGIPARILPWLESDAFLEAFRAKGRFRDLMERIPVQVALDPKLALLGAAWHGLDAMGGEAA